MRPGLLLSVSAAVAQILPGMGKVDIIQGRLFQGNRPDRNTQVLDAAKHFRHRISAVADRCHALVLINAYLPDNRQGGKTLPELRYLFRAGPGRS
ncbi:MAG: hypothetical protein D3911_16245 [Candidatus Electrothrix sp. AW3_4]|nr:hypothetical protein [Candidatus Electrothrix gigas]